jgi:hypothetical protein
MYCLVINNFVDTQTSIFYQRFQFTFLSSYAYIRIKYFDCMLVLVCICDIVLQYDPSMVLPHKQ